MGPSPAIGFPAGAVRRSARCGGEVGGVDGIERGQSGLRERENALNKFFRNDVQTNSRDKKVVLATALIDRH